MTKTIKTMGFALVALTIATQAPVALAKTATKARQSEKALCTMDTSGACLSSQPTGWTGAGEGSRQGDGGKEPTK